MKIMFVVSFLSMTVLLSSCSSAPSSGKTKLSELNSDKISAEDMGKSLMRGNTNYTEGYVVNVQLVTKELITKEENEKGKKNMDSDNKIKDLIAQRWLIFSEGVCFTMSVDTYGLETASFRNWRAKIKDSQNNLVDVELMNVSGVDSVPDTYKDMDGRTWHNSTIACAPSFDYIKGFTMYVIPQWKSNGEDGKSELSWSFE